MPPLHYHRQPRARARAWTSMRVLTRCQGNFTLPDLVATAAIAESNARHYLRALDRGGYLRRLRKPEPGRASGHALWRLIRDTGPVAPRVRRDGEICDPNERRTERRLQRLISDVAP